MTETNALRDQVLSIAAAAEYLDVSKDTVRRLISQGDLKAYRIGRSIRIHPRDVMKALKPVTTFRRSDY